MGLLFKNNAETTLSSGINNSTTTVPVTSAAVFPTPDANNVFFATIEEGSTIEVVKVTGISSNDLTVVRAQDNTSAASFGSGAKIELRLTAKILETGTSSLTDLDGDTQIQVEESADEDIIRFDVGGSEKATLNSSGVLDVDGGITVDNITIDGTEIDLSSGDLTLDVSGVIVLDADNAGVVQLKDGGSHYGSFYTSSDTLNIQSNINNADINFIGKDDNTNITALTLDMSEGGTATFNGNVDIGGGLITRTGDLTLDVSGDIILDADGGSITFKDDGLLTATLARSVGNFEVTVNQSDGDFVLKGNDGGSALTAITVDMSNGGEAIFYGGIDIAAGTDIELNDGTWTGEKARKIQAHSGHIYYQSASHVFRNASGNNVAQVDGSGNFVALANVTAYGSPSDIKLKEDIEVIDNAVDKVKQLKGVTYTLKSDGNRLTGLIAQDLEKVLPEAVYTSETIPDEINGEEAEEHLAIRYGNTVGLLVEAIKELSAKIEKLENK